MHEDTRCLINPNEKILGLLEKINNERSFGVIVANINQK